MGKNLKGKECGKGVCQRKDGKYTARFLSIRRPWICMFMRQIPSCGMQCSKWKKQWLLCERLFLVLMPKKWCGIGAELKCNVYKFPKKFRKFAHFEYNL